MLRPKGTHQRRLRRAFRPQPAARTPATGRPLGPLAGACESQHEATAVAIGRPGHHQPGLCCVVVLSCCGRRPKAHSQRTSPAPAPRSWRPRAWPCRPGRACAPDHRAKHSRPYPLACPPAAARERRLRRAGVRGAARPNAAAAAAAPSRSAREQGLLGLVARSWAQQMPGCFDGGGSSSPLQESRPGRGCH